MPSTRYFNNTLRRQASSEELINYIDMADNRGPDLSHNDMDIYDLQGIIISAPYSGVKDM